MSRDPGNDRWDGFLADFLEEHLSANPDLAVWAGHHEHDGRLPDWSPAGLRAELRRLRAALERARSFPVPTDPDRRLEREHLVSELERAIFWRDEADWPRRNPRFYLDALHPQVYVSRPYAPPPERMRAFTSYLEAIPEAASQIEENLGGSLPTAYRSLARKGFGGLAEYYRSDAARAFAGVESPELRRRFGEAAGRASGAMERLVARIVGEEAGAAADSFRLGEERFREMLRVRDGLELPLDRVRAAIREDLEANRRRLARAVSRLGVAGGVREAVARPAGPIPECPVETARRQVEELERHVRERSLASVPAAAGVEVRESPPYLRWNAAAIEIPGPEDRALPALFFLSPPNPDWTEAERAAYVPDRGGLLFITAHETWPGHYLQFLHAYRSASPVARLLINPSFAEGWAHYAEELCWETGLGRESPSLEICLLMNALLRDVRGLAAIELHAGEATVERATDLFRELAYQDPATAREQAVRGTFDPGYLSYTLGKLMIRKLREERGEGRSLGEFHDRLLSAGAPPIPLVRRHLFEGAAGEAL